MRDRFENFAAMILELNRCVQKIKEIELRDFNLKGTQGMCLYYLYSNPKGLTPQELTNLVKEDKAAISRAVKYLHDNQFISIDSFENDSKRNYRQPLFLTDKGKELAVQINKRIDEVLSLSDNGITEEERNVMYLSLEKINHNLTKYISEKCE